MSRLSGECRRGHADCSGVTCFAVCCVEIRCLSGPVTVYSIIFGDAEEMTFLFHCCHLAVAQFNAGWHIIFVILFNAVRRVNGQRLLSKRSFVFAVSLGGTATSHHVQHVLSPWQQFLRAFLCFLFSPLEHFCLGPACCQSLIRHVVFLSPSDKWILQAAGSGD